MKIDADHTPPNQYNDMSVFVRLEYFPESFTDEDLKMLLRVYSHSPAKGKNAQIPAKAFLILESRNKK